MLFLIRFVVIYDVKKISQCRFVMVTIENEVNGNEMCNLNH